MLPQRENNIMPKKADMKTALEIGRRLKGGEFAYYNATRLEQPRVTHLPGMGYVIKHETRIHGLDIPEYIKLLDEHLIIVESQY